MLIFTRTEEQAFMIGDDIRVVVRRIGKGQVSIGIEAPQHVTVLREELLHSQEDSHESPRHHRPGGP